MINVLDKRQTLCEKAVSLLRFSFTNNPKEGLAQKIRHFYDIYFLLQDEDCNKYIQTQFIYDFKILLEHDKNIFSNPEQWNKKEILSSILFTNFDAIWDVLKEQYNKELSALSYKEIPSAEAIGFSCKQLFEHINESLRK